MQYFLTESKIPISEVFSRIPVINAGSLKMLSIIFFIFVCSTSGVEHF